MNRAKVLLLTVVLMLAGVVATSGIALVSAQERCAPVALVPIRGSGEGSIGIQNYGASVTNGYEGSMVGRLLRTLFDQNPRIGAVPVVEVDDRYPAVPVNKGAEATARRITDSPVFASSQDGVSATIKATSDFRFKNSRGCTSTKFVLVGYSQGAMVARDVAMMLPQLVAGVYLIGDPWQKADQAITVGDGRGGTGVFRANFRNAGNRDAYYESGYAKRSICHHGDPVCDIFGSIPTLGNDGPHKDYFTNPIEATGEATALANMIAGAGSEPPPASAALNVAFVVDTTGSMSPYIADARANIEQISRSVLRISPSSKFSLVEYKDFGDPFIARTVVPLTGEEGELANGISTLGADGGGDTPESLFSGVLEGLRTLEGAPGRRAVVVLRDAPPHDPEPWTGLSSASLARILRGIDPVPGKVDGADRSSVLRSTLVADREQGPVTVTDLSSARSLTPSVALPGPEEVATFPPASLYDVNALGASTDVVGAIVDATGGRNFGIESPADVTTAILDAVDDAGSAPVAVLGVPPSVIAGAETVISGVASSGTAPLSFEFDLDNDGRIDQSNDNGVVEYTFPLPGVYTVTLNVTDGRGRTSTTSVNVVVEAPESTPNISVEGEGPDPSVPPAPPSGGSSGGSIFGS